ncbi:phosphatase PAP2 family protein [Lysinibacillus telephonicus]|uniref:phosphatase PAP2 family protein n=1 Tax=Lysinibacillus telephonicus TaxID=1714840 RepID=UPI001FE7113C|nr:phosphatase PAP2 family protein [Lysinibacillus telephonicus]
MQLDYPFSRGGIAVKNWRFTIAIITLFIFIGLLLSYEKSPIIWLDNTMSELLGGNSFIIAFHYIGNTSTIIIVAIFMLIFLWLRQRNYLGMAFVLLTVAAGKVLNQLIKNWIDRPRPEILDQLTTFSFPSGHAMLSLLYLFTIAYLLSEILSNKKKVIIIWILAIVLSFFIGLSRIAESRHYASDVIAGWCLGYSWFVFCAAWYEWKKRKHLNGKFK